MPCNCRKNSNSGNQHRAVLPRVPAKVFQPSLPPSNLPTTPNQVLTRKNQLGESDTMTAERRRIEKLRRDAVRRALGIG